MNLEIKALVVDEALAKDGGIVQIRVDIGERNNAGAESFYFVAASPSGLANEVSNGGFKLLRGYILMSDFDINLVRRSIENLIDHARSRKTWEEVVAFFNRYGVYDSEDLDGKHFP